MKYHVYHIFPTFSSHCIFIVSFLHIQIWHNNNADDDQLCTVFTPPFSLYGDERDAFPHEWKICGCIVI